MTGPVLHRELTRRPQAIPVVFIAALSSERTRPDVLEAGAVDCLFKPFSETALLGALTMARRAS